MVGEISVIKELIKAMWQAVGIDGTLIFIGFIIVIYYLIYPKYFKFVFRFIKKLLVS